jgi:hypothetical protein
LSLIGLFRLWIGPDRRRFRPSIALLAAALAGVIIVIWRYSQLALGTDQGRLLYPAVAAIILLFAAGLMALIPERRRPAAGWTLVGGALVLGVYALAGIIVPTFAPPDPLSTADLPTIDTENRISFGELALIGWTLAPEPILYWQADGEPLQDWRAVLRIRAADGGQIWERQRSPGAGRWATDRWPAGAIMADEYQIDWPDWVGPGRYSVEVALRPQGRDPVIPMGMESVFVLLGHIERE